MTEPGLGVDFDDRIVHVIKIVYFTAYDRIVSIFLFGKLNSHQRVIHIFMQDS